MRRLLRLLLYILVPALVALTVMNLDTLTMRAEITREGSRTMARRFFTDFFGVRSGEDLPDMSAYVLDTRSTHLMLRLMEHDLMLAREMGMHATVTQGPDIAIDDYAANRVNAQMRVRVRVTLRYAATGTVTNITHDYLLEVERLAQDSLFITSLRPLDGEFAELSDATIEEIDAIMDAMDMPRFREDYNGCVDCDTTIENDSLDDAASQTPEGMASPDTAAAVLESSHASAAHEFPEALPVIANAGFDASAAAAYGIAHGVGDEDTAVFKRAPDDDCTGFVSQCLWAGYGGTAGAEEDTLELRQRALDDFRQVPGIWFGNSMLSKQAYPATRWMRVNELYPYLTTNQGDGPRGKGFNDGKPFTDFTGTVRLGDVLQFRIAGARAYRHSAMVTQIVNDHIYVSQHDGDYTARPLAEVLSLFTLFGKGVPCDMRVIRPTSATFTE